ncbi:hypothetical protein RhiirA1_464750 [Rhizophagus irregularis]|uniref:Uncharacterized protein n=1 Tax=Rhizophagus irregularis TaxID=588596 RepID=A0A2N0RHF8_9GLOM|nr:hypothetical protein RhiirA1_464750 [Rhizophagus irregularis]
MFWNNGLQIGRIFDFDKNSEEFIVRHYIVISNQDNTDLELRTCSGCSLKRNECSSSENTRFTIDFSKPYIEPDTQ